MKNPIFFALYIWTQTCFGQQIKIGQTNDSFYIYKNDSLITNLGFTEVAAFVEGKTWVNRGEKYAFIDSNGLMLTEFKYDIVDGYSNGFAVVAVDSLFGFIDLQGMEITPLKYDRVRKFIGSFADVQLDELWGIIDTRGAEVIDPTADLPLTRLERNFFGMKYRGFWGVVDSKGKIKVPFTYDLILQDGTAYKNNIRVKLTLPESQD